MAEGRAHLLFERLMIDVAKLRIVGREPPHEDDWIPATTYHIQRGDARTWVCIADEEADDDVAGFRAASRAVRLIRLLTEEGEAD